MPGTDAKNETLLKMKSMVVLEKIFRMDRHTMDCARAPVAKTYPTMLVSLNLIPVVDNLILLFQPFDNSMYLQDLQSRFMIHDVNQTSYIIQTTSFLRGGGTLNDMPASSVPLYQTLINEAFHSQIILSIW